MVTTKDGSFTPRQIKILDVLDRGGYTSCGIGDLVDDDFCDLLSREFIGVYATMGASRMCHITEAGRTALAGTR